MRQHRTTVLIVIFLMCVAFAAPTALLAKKYPVPSDYPVAWELKFKHGAPKRIVVNVPGAGPTAYWYLTYTVTNLTDSEQSFLPNFEMVNNDGKVLPSDQAIPLKVFESIKSAEGNRFMEPSQKVAGILHIGEDQARDSVAIWPEPQARMGSFTIFVGGLSGEYVELTDDDKKPVLNAGGKQVILRKTLELDYEVLGDEISPGGDLIRAKPERWVMR